MTGKYSILGLHSISRPWRTEKEKMTAVWGSVRHRGNQMLMPKFPEGKAGGMAYRTGSTQCMCGVGCADRQWICSQAVIYKLHEAREVDHMMMVHAKLRSPRKQAHVRRTLHVPQRHDERLMGYEHSTLLPAVAVNPCAINTSRHITQDP